MRIGNQKRSLCSIATVERSICPMRLFDYWRALVWYSLFPGQHDPLTTLFQKHSFPFSKKKSYTADAIHRKQTCRGGLRNLLLSTIQSAPIPLCNIRRRNRWSGSTGLRKRNPQACENSRFGFDPFSFLHCDFSTFSFWVSQFYKGRQPRKRGLNSRLSA